LDCKQDGDLTDASSAGEIIPGNTREVETADLVNLQGGDGHNCCQTHLATLVGGFKAQLFCGSMFKNANSMPRSTFQASNGVSQGGT
jgi:hypothetical protein